MKRTRWLAGGCLAVLLAALSIGCSQRVDLAMTAPQAAEAIKSAFPDATLVKATREPKAGLKTYEATLMRDGRTTDVLVSAEGALIEIENQVSLEEVPAPAADTIKGIVGKGRITRLEKVEHRYALESCQMTRIDPPSVFYEVKYRKWGIRDEAQVNPDGSRPDI